MSWHLHGTVLTAQGTAGNNRGESEGPKSQLQKIIRGGDLYTTVSAEAIRYALREGLMSHPSRSRPIETRLELLAKIGTVERKIGDLRKPGNSRAASGQNKGAESADKELAKLGKEKEKLEGQLPPVPSGGPWLCLNRTMPNHRSNDWHDRGFTNAAQFYDDDVLGYMQASTDTDSRRSVLEVTRAISSTPWRGEIAQNFASPGSQRGKNDNPIPYAVEIHHTRYQYSFTLTPEAISKDQFERTKWTLEGLLNLHRVGGNHSHFLFDFAPEAIVLRWTQDPAARILYCFDEDEHGKVSLKRLKKRVEIGDIEADRLCVGSALDNIVDCPHDCPCGPVRAVESVLSLVQNALRDKGGLGR